MENKEEIKYLLTEYSKGAGCGCKIAPNVLKEIIGDSASLFKDNNLLIGNANYDDAAVYDLKNGEVLVSTNDFFLPIVDDAYAFGKIAAANALSDIYAMGARPIFALAILGWPIEKLPVTLAQEVMRGAAEVCAEAGIALAGGHSIDSQDPIFGLCVQGLANKENIKQNNGAQIGDVLILSKAIGVGILSTAQKRKVITAEDEQLLYKQLGTLNAIGTKLGTINAIHAMTDVTGFGLAGHLIEICNASEVQAVINYNNVPKIDASLTYLKERIVPDATYRNWNNYSTQIGFGAGINVMEAFNLLPDPQTNGGLLISVAPEAAEEVLAILKDNQWEQSAVIGEITSGQEKTVWVS
jgi:selenide, water dikinase